VQEAVNRAFYRAAPDCLIATADVTTEVFFTTLERRAAYLLYGTGVGKRGKILSSLHFLGKTLFAKSQIQSE
jgi:hypothetical protein